MEREKRPLSRRKNTQILSPPPPTAASSQIFSKVDRFFSHSGVSGDVPGACNAKDFYSDLIRGLIVKVDLIRRGRISCLLSVKPAATAKIMSMEKQTGPSTTSIAAAETEKGMTSRSLSLVAGFFESEGVSDVAIPPQFDTKGFFSEFVRGLLLKVYRVDRGRVSCLLSVKPSVTNIYGGFHGGAVASVAEMVSNACARTVVGKDKELFLGELSSSYLSSAPHNAELKVDASVVRSGRNLTVIAVEFKVKDSEKLVYTSRATFYNMPVASL